jgi:glycosyltransferase involved in cell wall biosynthesis
MPPPRLTVAWISDFPIEWLPDLPEELRQLPRTHPATWQMVLLDEFRKLANLDLHILLLRKGVRRDFTFTCGNVAFHVLKVPRVIRTASLFWVDTLLIRRKLRQIGPDLVHAWGTERGAGLVASRLDYPYLVTIQGLLSWYRDLVPLSRYERFAARMEQSTLRRCRLVTTESAFAARFLATGYPHLSVKQAEHAPNWVFHSVQRVPETTPVRFITVGSLGFRKGSDLLFRALHQIAPEYPFELTVVGSMSEEYVRTHRPLLEGALNGRVTVRQNLTPSEVADQFRTATIMVLPTRADTSPNAVKEAVVAGMPVVASAVGGIVDYVFPGENGLLFAPGNLQGLIDGLRTALRHPQFNQGKVNEETLRRMREYLSPSRMSHSFYRAYEEALAVYRSA